MNFKKKYFSKNDESFRICVITFVCCNVLYARNKQDGIQTKKFSVKLKKKKK